MTSQPCFQTKWPSILSHQLLLLWVFFWGGEGGGGHLCIHKLHRRQCFMDFGQILKIAMLPNWWNQKLAKMDFPSSFPLTRHGFPDLSEKFCLKLGTLWKCMCPSWHGMAPGYPLGFKTNSPSWTVPTYSNLPFLCQRSIFFSKLLTSCFSSLTILFVWLMRSWWTSTTFLSAKEMFLSNSTG